jgi:Domain of unknown function (DUF4386)
MANRVFGTVGDALSATVAAFAAMSALTRSIGILRWLTVMPMLAVLYANASVEKRNEIALVFNAMTSYGGGIGELLGVSLFMAIAIGTLAMGSIVRGGMPFWLSSLGVVSASLLAALLIPSFGGPDMVPIALAVSMESVWMLAAGIWCFYRK